MTNSFSLFLYNLTPFLNIDNNKWVCYFQVVKGRLSVTSRCLVRAEQGKLQFCTASYTAKIVPSLLSLKIGYNVETIIPDKSAEGLTFSVTDVGGGNKMPALWPHFCTRADGIIFVVDSKDEYGVLSNARHDLHRLWSEMSYGLPLLVFANKQDLQGALTPDQIIDELGLRTLPGKPTWHVQPACGTTGEGISEGFNKLGDMIQTFKHSKRT